ncbi:polysaccharide deacetylase family protein [Kribbella solani]|uniref:polysaccharide deacetylase family protein n=1 Tax=Kribbella solani TaxID=236067 RepID=UPI0029B9ACF2|nr:polysaccharide deacetylase family protein [Kribbella solani]MDX2974159.1 polysaccharide deacetylase family protein [Kribbella solani]MDX3006462.1 polysaccharide deacetylase family protein [Kribbella solani]
MSVDRRALASALWSRRFIIGVVAIGLVAAGLALAATPRGKTAAATSKPVSSVAAAQAARKYVYLTFDDGPSTYTPQVLKILRAYGARATFFEIGQNVARYPYLTRQVYQQGNSVQNHTWSHPDLRHVSAAVFRSQVQKTDRYIRAQLGYTPICLRPPDGSTNKQVTRRAAALGKKIRLWTIDTRDWSRPGTSVIVRRALANVHNGSVILMHDGGGNRSQTVAALPTILRALKARGFGFTTMSCT